MSPFSLLQQVGGREARVGEEDQPVRIEDQDLMDL
jgi:hypothetical protein